MNLRQNAELLVELTKKEIKIRYKNAFLGILWSLANPLAFAFVYYFVFKMAVLVGNTTIVRARQRKRPRRTSDVEVEAAEAEPAMSVRIGGRRVDTYLADEDEVDDEEYDEAEDDEYEDDEDDEGYEDDELGEEEEQDGEEPADGESPVAGGLRRLIGRAAPALRLNKGDDSQERQEVIAQLEEASRKEEVRDYDLPSIELLQSGDEPFSEPFI